VRLNDAAVSPGQFGGTTVSGAVAESLVREMDSKERSGGTQIELIPQVLILEVLT
jgi:hypothetical protein